jgi:putative ABC transport system permease protein
MVMLEAAHITIAATATGLVLGVLYGWAGAQSLLGSIPTNPDAPIVGTFVWPAVPLVPVLAIVLATGILTLVAAVVPTRLATRVAPVEALAE